MEAVSPTPPWDAGGILRPGWTRHANRTDKPERVLSYEQVRRLAEEDTS
jgi:hypothetical protein